MAPISLNWALGWATKPKRIPASMWMMAIRLFHLFISQFRTLLRTIGLKILTSLSPKTEEPSKVLVDKSRRLALARSAIHFLPASISIGLIALNIRVYFIGSELQGSRDQDDLNLGLLQVAAKILELLVVSSLGTVIFHAIRAELIFGDGLPLGLIVSGWSFTQLSYFWSPEFWAGFLTQGNPSRSIRRRACLSGLVFVAGMVAVLAGPAAAVLMIPRGMEVPVGGGIFWLNGSDEQLWPTYLDAAYYSNWDCSYQDNQLLSPKCPSAGFISLYTHYSTWWNFPDAPFQFQLQDYNSRRLMYTIPSSYPPVDTWAYTTHIASATLQDAFATMHRKSLDWLYSNKPLEYPFPKNIYFAQTKKYELKTKFPAVRTSCLSHGWSDLQPGNLTVRFPVLPESWKVGQWPPLGAQVNASEIVRDHLVKRGLIYDGDGFLNSSVFNGSRRILAVPISIWNETLSPDWNKAASSLGLILFVDRTGIALDYGAENFNLATCSIDARWARGNSVIQVGTHELLEHEFVNGRVRNVLNANLKIDKDIVYYPSPLDPTEDGPPVTIQLTPSWYDVFSPVISSNVVQIPFTGGAGENQTTLERIMDASMNAHRSFLLELQHTISASVADGLSRCGVAANDKSTRFLEAWPDGDWSVYNESLARTMLRMGDPEESFSAPSILATGNMTRMVMKAKFTGYAITARGRFDYFCIVLLLAHAVLALIHTIWVVWNRDTSGSWDSIAEMIALAHKSPAPPDPLLSNTCAGITSLKTLASVAWVEKSENTEKLQLRFREGVEDRDDQLKPEVGQSYNS